MIQVTTTAQQTPAIKDIATGIAYCLLIMIAMYLIPLVGVLAWVILPLPVLFYRLKIGRTGSAVIMLFCLIVLMIITRNIVFNLLYFGCLLTTGFFVGEFIEKYFPIEKIMLFTGLSAAAMMLIILFSWAVFRGEGLVELIGSYFAHYQGLSEQVFKESSKLYPQMNLTEADFRQMQSWFAMIFPGVMVNTYLTMVWINILLIKRMLKKRGLVVRSIENLNLWKAPIYLIFGVIIFSVLWMLGSGPIKFIAVNGLIILFLVYFFQGIAVVSYFFQKKSAPYSLRVLVYLLIALQPLFLTLVVGFGLFDTWANFRKIDIAA